MDQLNQVLGPYIVSESTECVYPEREYCIKLANIKHIYMYINVYIKRSQRVMV